MPIIYKLVLYYIHPHMYLGEKRFTLLRDYNLDERRGTKKTNIRMLKPVRDSKVTHRAVESVSDTWMNTLVTKFNMNYSNINSLNN